MYTEHVTLIFQACFCGQGQWYVKEPWGKCAIYMYDVCPLRNISKLTIIYPYVKFTDHFTCITEPGEVHCSNNEDDFFLPAWTSYHICKIVGCVCAGNAGKVLPRRRIQRKPLVADPAMHHGTCLDACRNRLPAVAGKTFPVFPAHAHPILLIW